MRSIEVRDESNEQAGVVGESENCHVNSER